MHNTFTNVTTYNNRRGIDLRNFNNTFVDIKTSNNVEGIYLEGAWYNVLSNIVAINNTKGIVLYSSTRNNEIINPTFINNLISISHGSFIGALPNRLIYNNNFGSIVWTNESFLSNMTIIGDLTFPGTVFIMNNSAFFNASAFPNQRINSSANVTLRGIRTNFVNPVILRDGKMCTDCHNFTSLNAGTVRFAVNSWSEYSIGEGSKKKKVKIERVRGSDLH
jgi:parallel beta-helix repeat protein